MSKQQLAVYDYEDDGFGGIDGSDLAIPFLRILQSNSPAVTDDDAKPGGIINSVTGEIVESLVFQPGKIQHKWVEWKPLDAGGGYVADHEPGSAYVEEAIQAHGRAVGKIPTENGTELVETYYVFGLILDEKGEGQEGFGVIAFSSTQIPIWKKWLTSMRLIKGRPPLFANRAVLTTHKTKNDKGTFWNWTIKPLGDTWKDALVPPKHDLLGEAQQLGQLVSLGTAKAAVDTVAPEEGAEVPF